jgi:capsular exopolysaccharide synthesis family protein
MSRIEEALNKAQQMEARRVAPPQPKPALPVEDPKELSLLSAVRTNLLFSLSRVKNPAVGFCSALSGEGVSTIVYYLSQLLSSERKTLVVDANFRAPSLHRLFKVDNGRGLSDLLLEEKSLEECIAHTNTTNLDLMPSGPAASAAHWFLGSPTTKDIIAACKKMYDIVLIDTPPLRDSPDTAVLGSYCDGVVMVVRARKTKRDLLQYAQNILDNSGAHQLGVVLNRTKYWIPGFLYHRL